MGLILNLLGAKFFQVFNPIYYQKFLGECMNIVRKAKHVRCIVLIADTEIFLLMVFLLLGMLSPILDWLTPYKPSPTEGLSSILALAIGYISVIRPWLTRPRIELIPEMRPAYSPKEDETSGGSWSLRILVGNSGVSTAKNCVGRLIEVRDSNGDNLQKFEPITLFWQRQGGTGASFKPVDIAGQGDYWVLDVAKIEKGEEISLKFRVVLDMVMAKLPDDHPFSPGREPHLRDNTYDILIGVQADNAYARPQRFRIKNHYVAADDTNYGFDKAPCEIKPV
jgi:hypothetical protein